MEPTPKRSRRRLGVILLAACSLLPICVGLLTGARPGSASPMSWSTLGQAVSRTTTRQLVLSSKYVVLAWNDLGMHCINPRFGLMAILPPFNNLWVQVLLRGGEPRIVRSGIRVFYEFPNNRTSVGKTDFWQVVKQLFGADVPQGVGLTGNGLAGEMKLVNTPYPHYEASGVPILPRSDDGTWNPFQQALITVRDSTGRKILAQALMTVPVSDELHCEKCHSDGQQRNIATGTVETNILQLHDALNGTSLVNRQPVLCASCHADNALGTPGTPGVKSMSEAMHSHHGSLPQPPACYDCHPGPNTQCNRSAIQGMGPNSATDPNCEHCHGTLQNVGNTIATGRRPWLDEPNCGDCHHGAQMDTGTTLYRHSAGHGGVACEACHNSPHAWYPSRLVQDNWQPLTYQKDPGPIGKKCTVCHTSQPEPGEGPHKGGGGGGD